MSEHFLDALRSGRVLLMDGAMGTELLQHGLPKCGECLEFWNLTNPERVISVHKAYQDSGADVHLTSTFRTVSNAVSFQRFLTAQVLSHDKPGFRELWKKLALACNRRAIVNLRGVVGRQSFVVGDIGPWEENSAHQRFIALRSVRQADAILLETFSNADSVGDAGWAREQLRSRECLLLSMAFNRDKSAGLVTHGGQSPEQIAMSAAHVGLTALGVNCGKEITVPDCADIIRRYRQHTDLPLFARPNAGTPVREGDQWVYPRTPEQMAAELPELLEAGVSMVGGCCGTTPAHIAAFRKVIDAWNARVRA